MTLSSRKIIIRFPAIALISAFMAAVVALASADAITRQAPGPRQAVALLFGKSLGDGPGQRDPTGDRGANRSECDETDLDALARAERGDGDDGSPPLAGVAATLCRFDMASAKTVEGQHWPRLEPILPANSVLSHTQARAPPAERRSALLLPLQA
jgi:hypothetical protein